jgi:hypothetical protein
MKSTNLKKFLITMAVMVAVLMAFGVTAFAEDYGNFSYTPVVAENDEFEPYNVIASFNAGDDTTDTVILVPDYIEDVPVTTIGASAFNGRTLPTEVIIPDTVTTIENAAFMNCTSLETIIIPDSVTYIGESAFQGCTALKNVIIGNGVKEIGDIAFKGCTALTALDLGDSVETIGNGAFFGCDALAKVYVPASVNAIGSFAFGFVQDGSNEAPVSGFAFYTAAANEAIDAYNTVVATEDVSDAAAGAFIVNTGVNACAEHNATLELVRKATDTHEGLELGQCADCLSIVTKANTDVEPVEKSFKDYISVIVVVVLIAALIAYCLVYVKKAKAHREASIAEFKAGKVLSDVELKNKQEAEEEAKYAKKRAKQEKKLEIFKK